MESVLLYLIDHFPDLMDINLTASIVILFVICVRQFLKRAPKIFSYALWGIVLLRLLVPVSIESSMSVVPERTEFSSMVEVNDVLPPIEWEDVSRNQEIRENTPPGEPMVQTGTSVDPQTYLTIIWLVGMVYLFVRSLLSYLGLRENVKVAIPLRKGIFIADDINTPFVMGIFRPVIYLPGTLDPSERKYIIAHELHHIKRGDHIFKALGFLALTIHWFNPLVWAAFVLAGRDMEMSCDEAVIRKLGEDVRAEYSTSLLNLATGQRIFAGTPLAFGEGDPTGRIRNLAKWKKPTFWVILICVVLCIVLAVCLLTNPESSNEIGDTGPTLFKQYYTVNQQQQVMEGTITEDFGDGIVTATFVQSSGPKTFAVELWYRSNAEASWDYSEQKSVSLTESATFYLPGGNDYVIMATAVEGQNGYVTFDCTCQSGISFADLDTEEVSIVELKNLHNGEYTFLVDQTDIIAVCDFLRDLSGIYVGSGKGYYEGTYQIQLLNDDQVLFSIGFGDSNSFHHGTGSDSYPNRYEPAGTDITKIVSFLSHYDSSGFVWDFLGVSEPTEQVMTGDWGVSLVPDRVSRIGATALFVYSGSIPGEEGAELTYGDYLSLERADNGIWVPVDELAGYDYYVGDSSYPVVNGYGMVHEWEDRFGKLQDGQYRLGKLVTLTRPDGSKEERMIYGEFSIPDSVLTDPTPLEELPELYSGEQAAIDGCLVCRDGIPMDNVEAFREFADACMRGEPGCFRIVNWYYGEDPHYMAEDIIFDDNNYTVKSIESKVGIVTTSSEFPYLKHFTGEKEERFPYDAYDHYVLVKDNDITWQEIFDGKYQANWRPIFQNYIYYPKSPDLPDNPDYAILEFKDSGLVTITDSERLEKLVLLFENAEYLGYEPKTHSIGVGLNLIFTIRDEDFVIELDPDSDLCRINGEYVWYGKPDEPDYILKLWEYLGITQWPDIVYMVCENALRP